MSVGLLFDCDDQVADFIFRFHMRKVEPRMKYDMAIGLIVNGNLSGGILFQAWNGSNIELSYYGTKTLTPGIIKSLARILVSVFNVSRVTVTVSRKAWRLKRSLGRLGFVLEGTQKRFWGHQDTVRNTGARYVMFRERIDELAQLEPKRAERCS